MADENVDLRFIGEQLACVLQEVDRLRTEQHEMRNELHQARQELAQVHNGQSPACRSRRSMRILIPLMS